MSIESSTTFTVLDPHTMPEIFQGHLGPDSGGCYLYGRHFNPTVYVLGRQLAAIEGTAAGYCTASGLSAIAAALLQCCASGDHVVASNTLYGGTFALLKEFLPAKTAISTTFVNINDLGAVERAITARTRVIYCETVANPTLNVADIPALAELAHRHGVKLVVDNTFTPLVISPARLGADVVIHSLTKYINGASDFIAGCICSTTEFVTSLMDVHMGALMLLGPTMDPHTAFHISLRLPHLPLRMREHSQRAQAFAERLSERGLRVIYPGLPTHPHHGLMKKIMNRDYGFGGILALDLKTPERANRLMAALQMDQHFGWIAVSLGYFDTLMSHSATSTSSELSEEDMRAAGLSPGLIRFSIGYTGSLEQRWRQMDAALKTLD